MFQRLVWCIPGPKGGARGKDITVRQTGISIFEEVTLK